MPTCTDVTVHHHCTHAPPTLRAVNNNSSPKKNRCDTQIGSTSLFTTIFTMDTEAKEVNSLQVSYIFCTIIPVSASVLLHLHVPGGQCS